MLGGPSLGGHDPGGRCQLWLIPSSRAGLPDAALPWLTFLSHGSAQSTGHPVPSVFSYWGRPRPRERLPVEP